MRFSMKLGGLICEDCRSNDHSATMISRGTIASLVHIERSSWDKALRLKLNSITKRELKYILNNFLIFHLERYIKAAKYLK